MTTPENTTSPIVIYQYGDGSIATEVRLVGETVWLTQRQMGELFDLPTTLQAVGELLEERNRVIHGRVYAVPGVGDVRISGRPGVPETPANSAELFVLANDLYSARNPLLRASTFSLHRQFEAVRARGTGGAQPVVAGTLGLSVARPGTRRWPTFEFSLVIAVPPTPTYTDAWSRCCRSAAH